MDYIIGNKVAKVVNHFESMGKTVEVIECNDRKMANFDETLVLKVVEKDEKVTVVSGNFLFTPIEKKEQDGKN